MPIEKRIDPEGENELWDLFCKTLAQGKFVFKYPDGHEVEMPNDLKPAIGGMAIQESGRGTNPLVKGLPNVFDPPLNFFSMKFRTDIKVPFTIQSVMYNGGDGEYAYCDFWTVRECIEGLWAFLHRWPYPKVDDHLTSGEDFIGYIQHPDPENPAVAFCPPGNTEAWKNLPAHNGRDYTRMNCEIFAPEMTKELKKYGWAPTSLPKPPLGPNARPNPIRRDPIVKNPYHITNGMLTGPNVFYRFVKNHDPWRRKLTELAVVHGTGCLAGKNRNGEPGILDYWDNGDRVNGASAQALILPDGKTWQPVDFDYPAWQCYQNNHRSFGLEGVTWGYQDPRAEVLGYFYKYQKTLWVQRIHKSELRMVNGIYYQDYTDVQYQVYAYILAAAYEYFPAMKRVVGHSVLNKAWDPGPTFDWSHLADLMAKLIPPPMQVYAEYGMVAGKATMVGFTLT